MDCNTCRCEADDGLLCTKMACITHDDVKKIVKFGKTKVNNNLKGKENKKLSDEKEKQNGLPALPDGECVPGKVYQTKCHACFCEDNKAAICSEKRTACETPFHPLQTPEDVRPKFTKAELVSLPVLPHLAARCEPGKSYKVGCNTCLCLPNYSLFCDHLLCLSLDDMHRIEADKESGKPCNQDHSLPSSPCVKCSCVNDVTKCEPEYGCQLPEQSLRMLHGPNEMIKPKPVLDIDSHDKCMPRAVYRDHCNRCYCQEDGSLRCTQKVCLNYVQAMKLKKHRLYLQKHGL